MHSEIMTNLRTILTNLFIYELPLCFGFSPLAPYTEISKQKFLLIACIDNQCIQVFTDNSEFRGSYAIQILFATLVFINIISNKQMNK